jgi:hypothetical protein
VILLFSLGLDRAPEAKARPARIEVKRMMPVVVVISRKNKEKRRLYVQEPAVLEGITGEERSI